jgi:hypothetical protein
VENRPQDALKSYLDVIRLGAASAHGGIAADFMIGKTIEALGREPLQRMLGALDANSCREAAETLRALDAQGESWKDASGRSTELSRQVSSSLKYRLTTLFQPDVVRAAENRTEEHFLEQVAKSRQLMIAFAARAYELEHQQKPSSFADLVPAYLKAIPQDPVTGTNLVFPP